MKIREFGVERWMDLYENRCELNLAETCVESLTVGELLRIAGKEDALLDEILPMKLTYGAIDGSDRLRANVASLYDTQRVPNILITHGAISANALIYETLVEPGDHVISVLPTYQQHYSIPESYGANVDILRLREENGFLPDLDELKRLVTAKTRVIAINNPNNPTGSLMDRAFLERLADIARSCGAYVLNDEVYRGTDQHGNGFTASIADLYEQGISTGSMSKTWSLAGLRVGWFARLLCRARRKDRRDVHAGQRARYRRLCADRLCEQHRCAGEGTCEGVRLHEGSCAPLAVPSAVSVVHPIRPRTLWVALTSCDLCGAALRASRTSESPRIRGSYSRSHTAPASYSRSRRESGRPSPGSRYRPADRAC